MSALENLRKRSGLLIAIVGLALFAFVLTGLFEGGSTMFGGSQNVIGEIAGKSIDYRDFQRKVEEASENQKRSMGKNALTEQETDMIVQQVWNQMINEEVLNTEYEKLGIAVSEEELYDLVVEHPHSSLVRYLSDQQGNVNPMFADEATGQVSPVKIRQFTASMTDEQEMQWKQLEEYVKQVRIIEKYNNLIKKGLYVTSAEAKRDYLAQNTNSSIKYIVKNYKTVADSTVTPSDAELKSYYNDHKHEFRQEASRKIEYVTFDVVPSQDDIEEMRKNMEAVAEEFKTKAPGEDSMFVVSESDSRFADMSYHTPGMLSPQVDSLMFKSEPGTVVGPYEENGAFIINKLLSTKTSADSAKVRHILIAYQGSGASESVTRNKEQAKQLADSLQNVLKKGGNFNALVDKFSDDGGKNMPPDKKEGDDYTGKGGNYGWLNAESAFVEPFKDAGLDNKKGDIVIAESQFGYHIIEVLDSKGSQKKVQVVTIDRKVDPSVKTRQEVFARVSQFAGTNTTNDKFQQAVTEQKLNKRIADNIKENDKTISGIESPRPLIKWAYENEKGAVSEPMEFGDRFIVAALTEVREKGIAPLEQVREEVVAKVIREKKAEKFTKEINDALAGGAATVEAVAEKLQLPVEQAQNVNFSTTAIPGSANEPAVIGTVAALKAKTMSKPVAGNEGVFLVYVDAVTEAPAQTDFKAQQEAGMQRIQPRADYEVYEALKKNANIEEHLVKFGY